MEEDKLNTISQMINELNIKYKNNPYMLNRLETHLLNLPNKGGIVDIVADFN